MFWGETLESAVLAHQNSPRDKSIFIQFSINLAPKAPNNPPRLPKGGPGPAKDAQRSAQVPPGTSKGGPGTPKDAQRRPKGPPKDTQETLKWLNFCSILCHFGGLRKMSHVFG